MTATYACGSRTWLASSTDAGGDSSPVDASRPADTTIDADDDRAADDGKEETLAGDGLPSNGASDGSEAEAPVDTPVDASIDVPPSFDASPDIDARTSVDAAKDAPHTSADGGPPAIALTLSAGDYHTCALLSSGTVRCWGRTALGYVPDTSACTTKCDPSGSLCPAACAPNRWPGNVSGLSGVRQIAAAIMSTCALLANGTVDCWGQSNDVPIVPDAGYNSATPVPLAGLSGVEAIGPGVSGTCAIFSGGTVSCWGATPTAVSGLSAVIATSRDCFLLSGGRVTCGLGSPYEKVIPLVQNLTAVTAIAAGAAHTCALQSDGIVKCWGSNFSGQLGDGTTTNSDIPVQVSGLSGVVALAAGSGHTCAVLSDGTVACWGTNDANQLGNAAVISSTCRGLACSSSPVPVLGLTGANAIAGGAEHTCVVVSDGSVQCWGQNIYGQLGNGTLVSSSVPTPVAW